MSGLIPLLRAGELRRVPVIGFSDTTPLLTWLTDQGLGPAIHGPVLNSLASTEASDQEALRRLLCEGAPSDLPGETWFPGEVRAPVIAGNLCMLAAHCGTPSQASARGRILILEEVGEPAYRVLRMLEQLRQAGVLDGVLGIGLGEFTGCEAPAGAGWTLADRLRDWLLPLGVPVVAGLPVGHGARNRPVVLGAVGRLG
jgi:muramoyltetrapeptide carboxypeptidase